MRNSLYPKLSAQKYPEVIYSHDEVTQPCLYFKDNGGVFLGPVKKARFHKSCIRNVITLSQEGYPPPVSLPVPRTHYDILAYVVLDQCANNSVAGCLIFVIEMFICPCGTLKPRGFPYPGDAFHIGLWARNLNLVNRKALTQQIMIESGHNFAHATTAQLSWHLHFCDLIRSLASTLGQTSFPQIHL